MKVEKIEKIIVHSGTFHADDAFAAALIMEAAGREILIERCYTVPEDLPDTVIAADIGRGKYDHHQEDARIRENGHKYAACGLVYEELAERLFKTETVRADFLKQFILPVEDADNGISNNPLTSYIDHMNADWTRPEENDQRFHKAVGLFRNLVREVRRQEQAEIRADRILTDAIARSGNKVILLDRFVPWQKRICETDSLFVVYYSARNEWTVQCVPPEPDSFDMRYPLAPMEEMEGCTFCHTARFLAAFDSKEHALAAAVKLVRESEEAKSERT